MSDDVDDLLRRTMATLDRQVPPDYFDALPARTLARLDDPSISDAPVMAVVDDAPGPVAGPVATPIAPRARARRGRIVAAAGIALAAAAGVAIFVSTGRRADEAELAAKHASAGSASPAPAVAVANANQQAAAAEQKAAVNAEQLDKPVATKPDDKRHDTAVAKGYAGKTKAPKPLGKASKMPVVEPLSAGEIQRAMDAVAGELRACAPGERGRVALRLTVEASGRVGHVAVIGALAGTPVGTCIERAAASARFPERDGAQRIDYRVPLSE